MRYLAFDIECCDGKHICEFGYVITDEKYNIIKKFVITINPESKFNLVGRPGGRDLYLFLSFSLGLFKTVTVQSRKRKEIAKTAISFSISPYCCAA